MDPRRRSYVQFWIPWAKKELDARGIKTETPLMPEPWHPDYDKFKRVFEEYKVTDNTMLVGHSCGCSFLVRWLGETKQRVNKLILVAPWKIVDKEHEYLRSLFGFTIDRTIKDRVNEIAMFTSDNEEEVGKQSLKLFHDALGGKIIELKEHGHYTLDEMKTGEFPELLDIMLA